MNLLNLLVWIRAVREVYGYETVGNTKNLDVDYAESFEYAEAGHVLAPAFMQQNADPFSSTIVPCTSKDVLIFCGPMFLLFLPLSLCCHRL